MMARKPQNHVTRKRSLAGAVRENLAKAGVEGWPYIPPNLVAFLEAQYPPRCIEPAEDLMAHHRYAGKVELIAAMRAHLNQFANFAADDGEPDDYEHLVAEGDIVAQINAGREI